MTTLNICENLQTHFSYILSYPVCTAKGVKMQIYLLLNALIKLQKWSILLFAEI